MPLTELEVKGYRSIADLTLPLKRASQYHEAMTRAEVIRRIGELNPRLAQFDVKSLSLFGSLARDEGTTASDVDLIVEFNGPSTFDGYFGLLLFLEDELGVKVDLAQPQTLHKMIRERVLAEALRVA